MVRMEAGKPAEDDQDVGAINIFLFSNGQQYSPPRKYHLRAEELAWWDATLSFLARSQYGSMHTAIDLHTIDGRKIETPSDLRNYAVYVAVVPPDPFIHAGYDKYLLKASRSWEKRQSKRNSNQEVTATDESTTVNNPPIPEEAKQTDSINVQTFDQNIPLAALVTNNIQKEQSQRKSNTRKLSDVRRLSTSKPTTNQVSQRLSVQRKTNTTIPGDLNTKRNSSLSKRGSIGGSTKLSKQQITDNFLKNNSNTESLLSYKGITHKVDDRNSSLTKYSHIPVATKANSAISKTKEQERKKSPNSLNTAKITAKSNDIYRNVKKPYDSEEDKVTRNNLVTSIINEDSEVETSVRIPLPEEIASLVPVNVSNNVTDNDPLQNVVQKKASSTDKNAMKSVSDNTKPKKSLLSEVIVPTPQNEDIAILNSEIVDEKSTLSIAKPVPAENIKVENLKNESNNLRTLEVKSANKSVHSSKNITADILNDVTNICPITTSCPAEKIKHDTIDDDTLAENAIQQGIMKPNGGLKPLIKSPESSEKKTIPEIDMEPIENIYKNTKTQDYSSVTGITTPETNEIRMKENDKKNITLPLTFKFQSVPATNMEHKNFIELDGNKIVILIDEGDIVNLRMNIEVRNAEGVLKTSKNVYNVRRRSQSLSNVKKDDNYNDDTLTQNKSLQSIANECPPHLCCQKDQKVILVQCACCDRWSLEDTNKKVDTISPNIDVQPCYVLIPVQPRSTRTSSKTCEKQVQNTGSLSKTNIVSIKETVTASSSQGDRVNTTNTCQKVSIASQMCRGIERYECYTKRQVSIVNEGNRPKEMAATTDSPRASKVPEQCCPMGSAAQITDNHQFSDCDCNSKRPEQASQDGTSQTDWCDVLLEARAHPDGHYTFHLPPLQVLQLYKF